MKRFKQLSVILLAISMIPATLFAHQGRTDGNGGHHDYKNKSGLGSYHYHCGGYPAHLHSGGVCPYAGGSSSSTSSSSSNSNSSSSSSSSSNSAKVTAPKVIETKAKFQINESQVALNGIVEEGRTLVEMRPLCEALGINLAWDTATSSATGYYGSKNFTLTIGSKWANVDGASVQNDVAPKLHNNKTYIPARFVAECIGKQVNFNNATGIIELL